MSGPDDKVGREPNPQDSAKGGEDGDDDEELLLDEDDEPTYSVLLREQKPWGFMVVAEILRDVLGMSQADAARIAKKHPGLVAHGIPREDAASAVRALRTVEVDCFLAPDHDLFPHPTPATVESLDFLPDGIRAMLSHATGVALSFPWLEVAFLAVAHIKSAAVGGEVHVAPKRPATGSFAVRPSVLGFASQVGKGDFYVLDAYCGFTRAEPNEVGERYGTVLHFDSTRFDFGCLGPECKPHHADNLVALLHRLAREAPHAVLTPSAAALSREGGRSFPEYENLIDFQNECLWRIDLLELERLRKEREEPTP